MIFIIIIIVLVLIVGGYFSHRQLKQREEQLDALANREGWYFYPDKNYGFDSQFDQFAVFSQGFSRYAYNTMTGALAIDDTAWPVRMGDYHYQTRSNNGKTSSTRTHRFSYLIVEIPFPGVPSLTIRREHLFDRMASFVGFDDIDFESAEFSNRFHVKSSDKRFAYDVIHPQMMEFMLNIEPPTIDIQRGYCCLYSKGKRWPIEAFREQASWVADFFKLWPDHITSALRT